MGTFGHGIDDATTISCVRPGDNYVPQGKCLLLLQGQCQIRYIMSTCGTNQRHSQQPAKGTGTRQAWVAAGRAEGGGGTGLGSHPRGLYSIFPPNTPSPFPVFLPFVMGSGFIGSPIWCFCNLLYLDRVGIVGVGGLLMFCGFPWCWSRHPRSLRWRARKKPTNPFNASGKFLGV